MQPAPVPVDHGRCQFTPHAIEGAAFDRVLEARESGLRRQRLAGDRIAAEQQLVNGIVAQAVAVVRVGVPAGQSEDALREQIAQRVPHLATLPTVDHAAAQGVDQTVAPLRGFQQNRPTVGTRVGLVEGGYQGLVEEIRKEDSLCYRVVAQSKPPLWGKARLATAFYHAEAFASLPNATAS